MDWNFYQTVQRLCHIEVLLKAIQSFESTGGNGKQKNTRLGTLRVKESKWFWLNWMWLLGALFIKFLMKYDN